MKNLLNEIKAMNRIAGTELTKEQEIALIKERLDIIKENNNKEIDSLVDKLIAFASQGDLENSKIEDIANKLKSARRKMFASKRTPDSYKAAAAKAKATKVQSKKDVEDFLKKSDQDDAKNRKADEKRRKNNLLPLETDDYSKKPDPKYYDYQYKDRGGWGLYKLKDKWKTTPVSPRTASEYWN